MVSLPERLLELQCVGAPDFFPAGFAAEVREEEEKESQKCLAKLCVELSSFSLSLSLVFLALAEIGGLLQKAA
jgi:hypothetical protein